MSILTKHPKKVVFGMEKNDLQFKEMLENICYNLQLNQQMSLNTH